jgi:hypothetical protein
MSDEQEVVVAGEESTGMSLVSNTLAIIGFVILVVVVVWGIFNIAKLSNFSFGNLFKSTPTVQITAPKTAASGEPLTVSWKNTSTTPGTYAFLYQCETGFSFAAPAQTGTLINVPCGTSINVGSSTAATMTPLLTANSSTPVAFSVVFTPENGSAKITGSVTLSITPAANVALTQPATSTAPTTSATTPKPSTSYHPVTNSGALVAHAASGPADLSVTIIASGYIDPASGALLMNRAPRPGDVVGVEFDIANIGGSTSGSYYFQAHLPTQSSYTYTSPTQMSLAPGAHVVSTLRFTMLAGGGGIFTTVADPSNQVSDANRANNEAATTIQ